MDNNHSEISRYLSVAAILLAIAAPISLFVLLIGFSLDHDSFYYTWY